MRDEIDFIVEVNFGGFIVITLSACGPVVFVPKKNRPFGKTSVGTRRTSRAKGRLVFPVSFSEILVRRQLAHFGEIASPEGAQHQAWRLKNGHADRK
jgi:hypothetical protein